RQDDDIAPKRERCEVHRDLAEQVQTVPPEEFVLPHVHDDVQMPGRAARGARLALALQSKLLSAGDARWNLDRNLPLVRDRPFAAARSARLRDDATRAATLGARPGHRKEALLEPHLPLATALRTNSW